MSDLDPLPEEKPIQAEVTPSHLPPLRTTVKNPIYLHKNAKCTYNLRQHFFSYENKVKISMEEVSLSIKN